MRPAIIARVPHPVKLYSSLNPPVEVNGINWKAISYILNHKQGNRMDIQKLIWYYTDGYTGLTTTAKALVIAANANLTWDLATAPILAIICLGEGSTGIQDTIIETRCGSPGFSLGYWKHNLKVYNGGPGSYSAQSGDMLHETDETMRSYAGAIILKHGDEAIPDTVPEFLAWPNIKFQDNVNKSQWLTIASWFNEASGLLPYTST